MTRLGNHALEMATCTLPAAALGSLGSCLRGRGRVWA